MYPLPLVPVVMTKTKRDKTIFKQRSMIAVLNLSKLKQVERTEERTLTLQAKRAFHVSPRDVNMVVQLFMMVFNDLWSN